MECLNDVQKDNTLVIFIHGISDSGKSELFDYFSNILTKQGIDSYIYDVFTYSPEPGSTFCKTDFNIYISTLDTIIEKYSKTYKNIFILGHSFGCLLGLLTKEKISGFLLLEPSLPPQNMFKDNVFLSKRYAIFPSIKELMLKTTVPKFLVFASLGGGLTMQELYDFGEITNSIIIENTDHNFSELPHRKILVRESLLFIKEITLNL